jgi:hypothetical protein
MGPHAVDNGLNMKHLQVIPKVVVLKFCGHRDHPNEINKHRGIGEQGGLMSSS